LSAVRSAKRLAAGSLLDRRPAKPGLHRRGWRLLFLAYVAGMLLEPLCQFFVNLSDSAQLLPCFLVVEGIGSRQDFLSACSQIDD
jgi:hypothetical protein